MASRYRGGSRRPRSPLHLVEILEDRLLLCGGAIGPGPGAYPPTVDHAPSALAPRHGGSWSAGPSHDDPSAREPPLGSAPSWDSRAPAGTSGSSSASGPGCQPAGDSAAIPAGTELLGSPWPGQPAVEAWADGRPVLPWSLGTNSLVSLEPPAAGEIQTDSASAADAVAVASPGIPLAGPGAVSASTAAADAAPTLSAGPGLLAALAAAGTSAVVPSADISGPRAMPAKEPGPAGQASLAPLAPEQATPLAQPISPASWGAATNDETSRVLSLPVDRITPVSRQQADLPRTAHSSASPATFIASRPALPSPDPRGEFDVLRVPRTAAGLLEAGLPMNWQRLRDDVDAFFARLAAPAAEEGSWQPYARLMPWVLLVSATATALIYHWRLRSNDGTAARDEAVLGPLAFLPEENA